MNLIKTSLVIILLFVATYASAEKVFVVVNEQNTQDIDKQYIKLIYSDKLSYWDDGEPMLVLELPVKSTSREKFSAHLLNKSAVASQRDWSNRFVNNTLKNQVRVKPQKLVGRFVSLKTNAIGYVSESQLKSLINVRVVMVIE